MKWDRGYRAQHRICHRLVVQQVLAVIVIALCDPYHLFSSLFQITCLNTCLLFFTANERDKSSWPVIACVINMHTSLTFTDNLWITLKLASGNNSQHIPLAVRWIGNFLKIWAVQCWAEHVFRLININMFYAAFKHELRNSKMLQKHKQNNFKNKDLKLKQHWEEVEKEPSFL